MHSPTRGVPKNWPYLARKCPKHVPRCACSTICPCWRTVWATAVAARSRTAGWVWSGSSRIWSITRTTRWTRSVGWSSTICWTWRTRPGGTRSTRCYGSHRFTSIWWSKSSNREGGLTFRHNRRQSFRREFNIGSSITWLYRTIS